MLYLNRYYLLLLALLLSPVFCLAQEVYDGQVIDKATENPIPSVTVTLLKEKLATQTNERGYFELSTEKPVMGDTLQFTSVGYRTFKLAVADYQEQMFIVLEASNTQLNQVNINKQKKLKNMVLDRFGYSDLKVVSTTFATHNTEIISCPTVLAKFFTAPNVNASLLKISLGRQDLHESPSYAVRNKFTTFLIHVMTQDSITKRPGNVIFTKTMSLNDNSLFVDIDLTDDHIKLPSKNFFIAVEWIINPYNEIIQVNNAPKVAKTTKRGFQVLKDAAEYHVRYQPFLVGYDPEDDTRKRALLYTRVNNQWRIFTQHAAAELALSATVHY